MLAPVVADIPVLILPASPDGRDLAPRLAAATGRPLAPGAVSVRRQGADLLRVDGQVAVEITFSGPVVATLMPGARSVETRSTPPVIAALRVTGSTGERAEAEVVALVPPDPATMDLADARLVLGGGAGLVPPGTPVDQAGAVFDLLTEVAAAMGASAGATRVVTDAGWMRYDRQIGTTGVAVDPDLYVALGVSGASQHTGGLGAPRHIVSVNTDPSCPMTAMADLGLVADGLSVLVELARHLDVVVPAELEEAVR
jgi:electron transfer flavoprotein alpha subunit